MNRATLIILAAAALAAPAGARTDKSAWQDARPNGPAENCIQISQIRETRVRNDRVIDFYTRGGTVYRNTIPNGCPNLGAERAFSYQTSISQLCSVDIITVLYQSPWLQRGASCGLGKFQPVTGAPR